MSINKTQEIMEMMVTLHNEHSYLAAAAKKSERLSDSYTHRTIARDLLFIINEIADGQLVDIKYEHRFVERAGIEYYAIEAEWA